MPILTGNNPANGQYFYILLECLIEAYATIARQKEIYTRVFAFYFVCISQPFILYLQMYGRNSDTDRQCGFNRHNPYHLRMSGADGIGNMHNMGMDGDWPPHEAHEEELLMDASVDLKRLRDNGKTPARLKEGLEFLNYIVERTKDEDKDHRVSHASPDCLLKKKKKKNFRDITWSCNYALDKLQHGPTPTPNLAPKKYPGGNCSDRITEDLIYWYLRHADKRKA